MYACAGWWRTCPTAPSSTRLPPDITPDPREHVMPPRQRTLTAAPDITPDRRKHPTIQRTFTVPPYISGIGDRQGLVLVPGQGSSPNTPSSWRQHPHRREVAA